MKRKTLVSAVLCSALLLQASSAFAAETGGGPGGHGGHGGPGDGMGGFQTENDPEIQEVIDGASSKFSQFTYTDSDTGEELEYSLYIPEDYDESMDYPIPDLFAALNAHEAFHNWNTGYYYNNIITGGGHGKASEAEPYGSGC